MRKVFLENLPKRGNLINWRESIGYKVPFIYDDIEGEVEILEYSLNKNKLNIKYKNKSIKINTGNLTKCALGNIVGRYTKNFKVEIGEKIKDNNRDLNIISREYKINEKTKKKLKYYKYECNICGNIYHIEERRLLVGFGCNVCSGRATKLGINTIWDTDRWMCDLGVSEEDAKKYRKNARKKITVKCPDCGRERKVCISHIYDYRSIFCPCKDGKSYPEKFIISLLEQLNVDFEIEYSPEWVKPKRYDFYIKDNSCIIEANGLQHYKEGFITLGGKVLEEEQANDKYKREIALANGIKHYITLDCRESNLEWIKNSILNSELNDLFDLSNVNWTICAEFANKNIVKEVCNYWSNKREDETTTNLMKEFKLSRDAIIKYLKKGTKLGWCNYNPKEEGLKGGLKGNKKVSKLNCKKVEIFKNNKSLGIFPSCAELERQSEELFGVKLLNGGISRACTSDRKQYKGFTFKYI